MQIPQDFSPLWISLKTASLATLMTFFLGIAAAYWMWGYRGKAKSLIEGIFVAPLILPPTVVGFLLLLLFGKNGPFGKLLLELNINIVFTWYAAVITATVVAFPLMYRTALGAFEQIDGNLLRAAKTLGATDGTVFWRISLPLALPGLVAGSILAFCRALGEFGATLMLAGNIPGETQTLPMAIYFAVEGGAVHEAWIWVLLIVGITLSAITAVNFWVDKKAGREGSRGAGEQRSRGAEEKNQLPITNYQLPITNSGLFVDIEKQLNDFKLNVAFSSSDLPLGLLGASGSGKSTILRCIAGIETPDKGRIVLNGRVLFDSEAGINLPPRSRRVGFLFQNYALFPHLTVAQNIAFGLPKGTSKNAIKQQVEAQLAKVQLQGFSDRYPHQLSGGEQQRVALARTLASEPEVLLLDEPFSALDTYLRSQLEMQLISVLDNYPGVTLFVTHNLEEAYRVCENLLVVDNGVAIASDAKQNIFEHPHTFRVAQLTGCKNFSRAKVTPSGRVEAIDWDCDLQVVEPIPEALSYIGIRAHQLIFTNSPIRENTFPCWLVQTSETQHRITLYLKLNSLPKSPQDYHLQAEVFKEKWEILKEREFPWLIQLHPLKLFLMSDSRPIHSVCIQDFSSAVVNDD
ncbi:ABC transporter, ATP-binding protein [Microseira wollei NIES-4236]|uniref:ABC transporter, ATP-binding protein n=1 Tax=Microseira wollei NIES-4236 TaxID=2530354 RepID=A0AAV3X213_9CYAN|nr:molybdate ABC transporter permease subunit [Microseira wollei]GET36797.1 ABC transporter, ATP-binding protein [Microseira wollei NIES-4236]